MTALRWVPGMVERDGALCVVANGDVPHTWLVDGVLSAADPDEHIEPKLDDPGTVGHIAAQARAAMGRKHLYAVARVVQALEDVDPRHGKVLWFIRDDVGGVTPELWLLRPADSEGEAWLECLEAAP